MEFGTLVIQVVLGFSFLMAGFGKVVGTQMHVEGFIRWRLPQWFRVVTGILELLASLLLLAGIFVAGWALYGAILLVAVGVGGVLTHLRVKDSFKETLPILVLGVFALILIFLLG